MKTYAIGDRSYSFVKQTIEMINGNTDIDGEERIPLKFYHDPLENGWFVECLNKDDEPRLEKHLKYIFQLE